MTFREQFKEELEEAEKEGVERGLARGLEQGLEQGIRQGINKTAVIMLNNDLPTEQISKYTGLSVKEIEELKNM